MTIESHKILRWKNSLAKEGCTIASVTPLSTITKKNGDPLFSLLDVAVTDPEGKRLPHIVFIRGHAVIVVPLLINAATDERRFLMVRQRRIGNGILSLEFPAGMIDHADDKPSAVALRELTEETGLVVARHDLVPLVPQPLYSSAGASDEAIFYFGCIQTVSAEHFASFIDKKCGNHDEHEYLTVTLLTQDEAEKEISSVQAHLGIFLFNKRFGTQ